MERDAVYRLNKHRERELRRRPDKEVLEYLLGVEDRKNDASGGAARENNSRSTVFRGRWNSLFSLMMK